jgi:membrane protein implicated in regulation of membrane protease activity
MPTRRERELPARPFRDSAIAYAVMAAIVVVIGLVTGGGIARALVIAAAFFVLATAWSWWRFRTRIEQRNRR